MNPSNKRAIEAYTAAIAAAHTAIKHFVPDPEFLATAQRMELIRRSHEVTVRLEAALREPLATNGGHP